MNTTILQKRADSLSTALSVTNSKISQTSLSITAAIKTSDSISTQLKARMPFYEQADLSMSGLSINVNGIVEQIAQFAH